jgi:hypothetical protein
MLRFFSRKLKLAILHDRVKLGMHGLSRGCVDVDKTDVLKPLLDLLAFCLLLLDEVTYSCEANLSVQWGRKPVYSRRDGWDGD